MSDSLAELWRGYQQTVAELTEDDDQELRTAVEVGFFSGALAMMRLHANLFAAVEDKTITLAQAEARYDEWMKEIDRHNAKLLRGAAEVGR